MKCLQYRIWSKIVDKVNSKYIGNTLVEVFKDTSNYLDEIQNLLKLTQIFLNFLYDIRGIFPEININLLCSFPP